MAPRAAAVTDWDDRFSAYARRVTPSPIRALAAARRTGDDIAFGPGQPDPATFPVAPFHAVLTEIFDDPPAAEAALQYASSQGDPALRAHISRWMRADGAGVTADNILLTSGAQQGIHLATAAFADPGNTALVQAPTYPGTLQVLRAHGVVPGALGAAGGGVRPALVYAMANFQNPTGASLSLEERRRLLASVRELDTVLVEDDPYGALRYDGSSLPSLLALDAENRPIEAARTLYLGSFSKTIAPGLRLGWVAGPRAIIEKMALMKQAEDLQAGSLVQAALVRLLDRGVEPLIGSLTSVYRTRRDAMLEALRTHFGNRGTWQPPQGGFFVWVTLPSEMDATELLHEAAAQGVTFVPGAAFAHDGSCANALRLSFSIEPLDRIDEGVKRLARAFDSCWRRAG